MNESDLRILLHERFGVRKARRSSRAWVNMPCPFAPTRHSEGKDENPSFGIKISATRSSNFNCKGCHITGDNLLQLVVAMRAHHVSVPRSLEETFWWVLRNDNAWGEVKAREDKDGKKSAGRPKGVYDHVASLNARLGIELPGSPAEGVLSSLVPYEPPTPTVLPESDLDRTKNLTEEALMYLQGRRFLQPETIAAWELGFVERAHRISIPIRDYQQRLVGISGRLLDGYSGGPKFLHSLGFRRDYFLYGEAKVERGGTGIVTEGFFNVIGLWQSGYRNVVAIMGSYPSKHQVEKLVMFFDRVLILGDGDKAGREMALKVLEAVQSRMPARVVDMPEGKDPQELTPEEKIQLIGPPDRLFDNRTAM